MLNHLKVQVDISDEAWDKLIGLAGTVFHYSEWMRCIISSFGGLLVKAVLHKDGEPLAAFPLFMGQPWSSESEFRVGAIGYGGPVFLSEDSKYSIPLKEMLLLLQGKLKASCVGLRGIPVKQNLEHHSFPHGVTYRLNLISDISEIFHTSLNKNIRTAVRKALKENIFVRPLQPSEFEQGWKLVCHTQQEVKSSYTTPLTFINNIMNINHQLKPIFLGAFSSERLCACGLFLVSQRETFHMFHGWDRSFSNLCPNQLLIWRAIESAHMHSSPSLNFGESPYESLKVAKSRWGGTPEFVINLNKFQITELLV